MNALGLLLRAVLLGYLALAFAGYLVALAVFL